MGHSLPKCFQISICLNSIGWNTSTRLSASKNLPNCCSKTLRSLCRWLIFLEISCFTCRTSRKFQQMVWFHQCPRCNLWDKVHENLGKSGERVRNGFAANWWSDVRKRVRGWLRSDSLLRHFVFQKALHGKEKVSHLQAFIWILHHKNQDRGLSEAKAFGQPAAVLREKYSLSDLLR